MKTERFNKIFNAFILIGMTLVMLVITAIKFRGEGADRIALAVAAFGSLMGVLSTVCSANGKILTFIFGFLDVTIYGIMCFTGGKYGNAAMHLLYFLPMQFIGFAQWRRRGGASAGSKIRARRLGGRGLLPYLGIFLAGLVISYSVLAHFGDGSAAGVVRWIIVLDAFSMMCNILGQYLMSMAYMEQWIFWIGVNISTVVMWLLTLRDEPGSTYALVYIIKYAFYLLNSLNGLRIWLGLSRPAQRG